MAKKSPFTVESLKDMPWLSITVFGVFAWYILSKIGNSATWLGSAVQKVTNPSSYDKQVSKEVAFVRNNPTGSAYLTPQKCLDDARKLAIEMETTPDDDPKAWWNWNFYKFWNDEVCFNIANNYSYAAPRNALQNAYRTIYTDGRDLNADLNKILSNAHKEALRKKGIL